MDNPYAFLRTRNREGATAAAHRAARGVPPLWPLPSSVAVNPFLGQSAEDLAHAGARLARVAGAPVAMPRTWYRDLIADGTVTDADLCASLSAAPAGGHPLTLATLKAAVHATISPVQALPTVADLAADVAGVDWPGLIANRLGAWAADYFDCGQALWAAPHGPTAYAAWRSVACHDLTPEIIGLTGFAAFVSETPERARDAVIRATERLGLPTEALDTYFHRLLMSLGGWAQFARTKLWQAEQGSGTDSTLTDLLAIRLVWEEVLFHRYAAPIGDRWEGVRTAHASPITSSLDQRIDALLQEATERAAQRRLGAILAAPGPVDQGVPERPAMQAVFCIDVRSEVFRRALEAANPAIRTHGMAGFFGMATEHRRFASDVVERRLPVLLAPGMRTCAGGPSDAAADQAARFKARAKRAWVRFKFAAVSSFAFVEASGPLYVAKLLRDALGGVAPFGPPDPPMDPPPRLEPGLLPTVDPAARVAMAAGALRSMGLTSGFARLVLLSAHGANIVNNPHAAGLQCGACGGSSGEVNARLLAALVNDPAVRAELVAHHIDIPADTLFVAALHDTTSDEVTLYVDDHPSTDHQADLDQARRWLAAAGVTARAERAARLPRAGRPAGLRRRGGDWAEVRPEWGLAGCMAFIAAPRARTLGKSLHGRAFLHDYDWRQDADYAVLEMILTAPVVVAGWISLQYYGSTVAPQVFGSGNKILHNVTGGIGVVEGNGGVLRGGLPWQSVHDGQRFVHEPLRLSVCVEAPCAAITAILQRYADLRMLFDNRWLHLISLDSEGRMSSRYAGDLRWLPMAERA